MNISNQKANLPTLKVLMQCKNCHVLKRYEYMIYLDFDIIFMWNAIFLHFMTDS